MPSAPTRLFNWPVVWHSRGRAGWRFRRLSAPTNNYLRPPVRSCSRSSTLAHLVESASLNTLTIAASPPCHWLRVLCGHPSLNTEHTEHLRDLSVEALEARRPQRTSHVLRPTGRAVNSSWNLQLMPVFRTSLALEARAERARLDQHARLGRQCSLDTDFAACLS